ncbi:hypothetical protein QR680_011530 [Steinernema hermaphroditum]|uniref:RING-type domain-containing protein n=1 Tax=Steinernema hermaphroditum TaxID=289476 RepID=A0AA39LZ46_9BILA|nr:hypothetical protein QR680_011530 [Steinernema hermaphroditum]
MPSIECVRALFTADIESSSERRLRESFRSPRTARYNARCLRTDAEFERNQALSNPVPQSDSDDEVLLESTSLHMPLPMVAPTATVESEEGRTRFPARRRKRATRGASPPPPSSPTPPRSQKRAKKQTSEEARPDLTVDLQNCQKKLEQKERELDESAKKLQETQRKLALYKAQTEETLSCAICMDIMYRPMVLTPCGHKFCSSCLSPFFQRPLGDREKHCCPHCREPIRALAKDSTVAEMIENYFNVFPELKPDEEECETRDSNDDVLIVCEENTGRIVLPPERNRRSDRPLRIFR